MSRTYDRFLHDLRAEGPEKKDGFDLEALRGLGGAERLQAAALLQQAILDGDATAVPALLAVDPVSGPSFLRAHVDDAGSEFARVRIVATLLQAGRAPEGEAALPALLQSNVAVIRHQAIQATRHLWSTEARLRLLPQVLQSESDMVNRLAAASELLHALGRSPGDARVPDFRDALAALRSPDAALRTRALTALGL